MVLMLSKAVFCQNNTSQERVWIVLTSHGVCLESVLARLLRNIRCINMHIGMSQEPDKVLDLITIILMRQHLYEVLNELLRVFHQKPTAVTKASSIWIENIRSEECAKVDNQLLGCWHIPFAQSTKHLIGVKLLVDTTLESGVFIILWEERLRLRVAVLLAGSKAGRHDCC